MTCFVQGYSCLFKTKVAVNYAVMIEAAVPSFVTHRGAGNPAGDDQATREECLNVIRHSGGLMLGNGKCAAYIVAEVWKMPDDRTRRIVP